MEPAIRLTGLTSAFSKKQRQHSNAPALYLMFTTSPHPQIASRQAAMAAVPSGKLWPLENVV
jgi:hypothetical protein